jgi:hypothetical protein
LGFFHLWTFINGHRDSNPAPQAFEPARRQHLSPEPTFFTKATTMNMTIAQKRIMKIQPNPMQNPSFQINASFFTSVFQAAI